MLVKLDFYFEYFIWGMFLTWFFIYINLPNPEIYELKKENFNNKCFSI